MCGICGLLDLSGGLGPAADVALDRMSRSLRRRGPDDAGRWGDTEGRVRLAFRRLAILDLSPAGAQPMLSPSGRTAMVFNGEIYNFRQLRRELGEDAASLGSTGDSAVLLAAFERWGLDALPRLDGMFAAAFWETDQRRLTLVRDRFGIKPLSLFEPGNGRLAFASRYDTLLRSPWSGGLGDRVRRDALRLFLRLGHLPAPWAVLDTTRQLEAGAWLQVEANGTRRDGRFWRPPTATADLERDPRRALERIEDAIESSVERQLAADVPLGVFLSGGVDSPLVAAAARAAHNRPIDAFTLGVPGWAQDESADARRLAGPLDLRHHLLKIEDAALVDAVDAVRQAQHEPFADYSMVPTLLISRFARERVKVALSGDGG
ncbi:MAG: asparagine synthase (glutamine-hydrolyzing), partial [Acidobacteriota bacterium]